MRCYLLNTRGFIIPLTCVLLLASGSSVTRAQTRTFTQANVDYVLQLPSARWRAIERPDSVHQHTEFIYADGSGGRLRIRKEAVEEGVTPIEQARRDRERILRYLPGYVADKEESFAGRLSGITFSYEYVIGGSRWPGGIYYLQADNRTIYTLRFTGMSERLLRIRNQTDFIARSFHLK